jgi:hypothetical protein
MATHEIELALRDGDASWCACTCGWVSEKTSEDEAASSWGAHVAQSSLTTTSKHGEL